jgi:protein TonB
MEKNGCGESTNSEMGGETRDNGRRKDEEGGKDKKNKYLNGSITGEPTQLAKYLRRIQEKIARSLIYPEPARKKGVEGKTCIKFLLLPSGNVARIELIKSSGEEVLDDAAVETIKQASPFSFYEDLKNRVPIWIRVPIAFKLTRPKNEQEPK